MKIYYISIKRQNVKNETILMSVGRERFPKHDLKLC